MSELSRVPVAWSGAGVVGGGFSVLHCTVNDEHALMSAFRTFLNAINGNFPTSVSWSFPTSGPIITQEDGELADAWVDPVPVLGAGGASANTWVNGVGLRVKWTTGSFYNGRAVVGSTFLVPLQVLAYEGSNNIVDANRAAILAAATTFVAAAGLRIYSKPREGVLGQSFAVNGCEVPDRVSWLRGRRT